MNKPPIDFDGLDGIMGDGPPFVVPPKTPPPPPLVDEPPWLSPPLTPRTQETSDFRARAPVTARPPVTRLPPVIAALILLGFIGAMGVALGTLIVHAAHVTRAQAATARAPTAPAPSRVVDGPARPVVDEPAPLVAEPEHVVEGPKLRLLFPAAFSFNSTKPTLWGSPKTLRTLVDALQACTGPIVATGHTCTLGTEDANVRKGLLRAEAARDVLVRKGIDRARIEVTSAGSREPVASNATQKGRRANRRVTVSCSTSR